MVTVMKFGGTSVSELPKLAEIVKSKENYEPIVVVSAFAGATNMLEKAIVSATKRSAEVTFEDIINFHNAHITKYGLNPEFLDSEYRDLNDRLKAIRTARKAYGELTDGILYFGESVSHRVVAAFLEKEFGIDAQAFHTHSLGLITDSNFGNANILPISYQNLNTSLIRILSQGTVPVLPGYGAKDINDNITTLGRGGSDLTATVVAAALKEVVRHVEIWTDVPGIMTADPRVVPTAKPNETCSPREAAELSGNGARVILRESLVPASKHNILIKVLSTFDPNAPGTKIVRSTPPVKGELQNLKGIAHKDGQVILTIVPKGIVPEYVFMSDVFSLFKKHKVSTKIPSSSNADGTLSLLIDKNIDYSELVCDLSKFSNVKIEKNMATVYIVGHGMKDDPVFAGFIFSLLGRFNISKKMIAQGASEDSIGFAVKESDLKKTLMVLHKEFFETSPEVRAKERKAYRHFQEMITDGKDGELLEMKFRTLETLIRQIRKAQNTENGTTSKFLNSKTNTRK